MDKLNEVRLHGAKLEIGETTRDIECPWCGKAEKGCLLTKTANGLFFKCFHARCSSPSRGKFISEGGGPAEVTKKIFQPKEYKDELVALSVVQQAYLINKYGLTYTEIAQNEIKYNPSRDSYVFSIFDYHGNVLGLVDRAYWGRKPKSITYWFKPNINLGFPKLNNKASAEVVLVEDIISAIKVGRYKRACAILGSSITDDGAAYLADLTSHIVEALDPDTWIPPKHATKFWKPPQVVHQETYSFLFDRWDLMSLPKDPKDMKDNELVEYFYG